MLYLVLTLSFLAVALVSYQTGMYYGYKKGRLSISPFIKKLSSKIASLEMEIRNLDL